MKKMNKRLITLGTMTFAAAMGVTLAASPVLQNIKAQLNPNIEYKVNGETALEDKVGILYEDTIYIPLRAAGETFGLDVHYEPGKVTMNQKDKPVDKPDVKPVEQAVEIKNAEIVKVDAEANQVTIIKNGDENLLENQIILNLGEDTTIRHEFNKRLYKIDDLEVGNSIHIKHDEKMTFSIPPQTPAMEIVLVGDQELDDVEKEVTGNVVKIDDQEMTITTQAEDIDNHDSHIIVMLSEDIDVDHITIGDSVIVETTGTMTASLPPQVTAVKVNLIK